MDRYCLQWRSQRVAWVHVPPPVVAGNISKVYYFCCVEFLCILFSPIFSMCLHFHRGSSCTPLHPAGGPLLLSPVANSWLRPCVFTSYGPDKRTQLSVERLVFTMMKIVIVWVTSSFNVHTLRKLLSFDLYI